MFQNLKRQDLAKPADCLKLNLQLSIKQGVPAGCMHTHRVNEHWVDSAIPAPQVTNLTR